MKAQKKIVEYRSTSAVSKQLPVSLYIVLNNRITVPLGIFLFENEIN